MLESTWQPPQADLFNIVRESYFADDLQVLRPCLELAALSDAEQQEATDFGKKLLAELRANADKTSTFDSLMQQYDLSCKEGVQMMCLAEALLRIPDKQTIDLLLSDKLSAAKWQEFIGQSKSRTVNMATWGLLLGDKVMGEPKLHPRGIKEKSQRAVQRLGAPVVRQVVRKLMTKLSEQFIVGMNIDNALKSANKKTASGNLYSYDMLGEAARTMQDADRYFESYKQALNALSDDVANGKDNSTAKPSLSVKLSALHPRYELAKRETAVPYIVERMLALAAIAKKNDIQITIDAEECSRLELSLEIFYKVFSGDECSGWNGLGLALQCYQKRSFSVLNWCVAIAKQHHKKIPIRLVKGAYWDSEIKHAQEQGFEQYPVFTRRSATDVMYLACARLSLQSTEEIIPRFATHNVATAAAVLAMAGDKKTIEFQHLHGMGDELHKQLVVMFPQRVSSRIYAPVGVYCDLLPYLVRRLLENGANSSFVQQLNQKDISDAMLLENPIKLLRQGDGFVNRGLVMPLDIYQPLRANARGFDLEDVPALALMHEKIKVFMQHPWDFRKLQNKWAVDKKALSEDVVSYNPANKTIEVGYAKATDAEHLSATMDYLAEGFISWKKKSIEDRAGCLLKLADLIEENSIEFIALINREAGRTYADAVSELREAVDFCRYYATDAAKHLKPRKLPGPTGEENTLHLQGKGVITCISPWNFPLAIFTGQITAALMAGNAVLAKPASLTPLCALRIVELAYQAEIPRDVLQCVLCSGRDISRNVLTHSALGGVMLTGSNATADAIAKTLQKRRGAFVPLIAETGGLNALIADSSAFIEQLVDDVLVSAFGSAGQRCSSLRVLCVQEDIADKVIEMLSGAMENLTIADPVNLSTDIGPLIDAAAQTEVQEYIDAMLKQSEEVYPAVHCRSKLKLPAQADDGFYVAPTLLEVNHLQQIEKEVFGPVLHVYRYRQKDLDQVISSINSWGYGLTCGIHSRIDYQIEYIQQRMAVGNVYVNRNMIGAVVGTQPFGGQGLSGTGPKAGGPNYMLRLCNEKTVCVNTAAVGGNIDLLAMESF